MYQYYLYRSVNREPFNLIPIHTWDIENNPNKELKYIDVVTNFGDGNGRFCYYIHAIEGNNNPYGPVNEGSFSNITCVSQTQFYLFLQFLLQMVMSIMKYLFLLNILFLK